MKGSEWMTEGEATSEEDTERDGFLSYSVEVHAVGHGLFEGLTTRPTRWRSHEPPENPDVRAEPHYYKGGFVAGSLLQVAILVAIGAQGLPAVMGAVA